MKRLLFIAALLGTVIVAGQPPVAKAVDITCAAGASNCVRDRLRQNCVLLNPPYSNLKVTRWRCPDPPP